MAVIFNDEQRKLIFEILPVDRISSREIEHVERTDRDLRQQNTAALDVRKEAFDHAVAEADNDQKAEKRAFGCVDGR